MTHLSNNTLASLATIATPTTTARDCARGSPTSASAIFTVRIRLSTSTAISPDPVRRVGGLSVSG
ncbi:hypothetical protein Ae717Ps2_6294 [Pseudonocardia sp. Ae717_Ps2]|nr:hypothetical protein Ae717Ps2_6294 [Pseudonocardia sp. Ae717_Ps2]